MHTEQRLIGEFAYCQTNLEFEGSKLNVRFFDNGG